ncbi:MAG: AAA family ATPase [Deltaproteobacteria bacterium]
MTPILDHILEDAQERGLELDDAFYRAIEHVQDEAPFLLITGRAGTGKSTLIHLLRDALEDNANVAVVAPTGLAAIQIGGQTIHSFCRLPPRPVELSDIRKLRNRSLYENLDVLIVDEISMVRADLLDGIEKFLRMNGPHRNRPFGGVRMICVGDLFQLAPVVRDAERPFFEAHYASEWFFDAACLRDSVLQHIELEKVHRQEDSEDLALLDALRDGGPGAPQAIEGINQRCSVGFPDGIDEAALEGRVTLTTRVNDAETRNRYQLRALAETPRRYMGRTEGNLPPTRERLPAPMQLDLAVGAQVLFTRNDPSQRWVNGTLGRVVSVGDESAEIEILWGPGTGDVHEVSEVTWESTAFEWNPGTGRIETRVVGKYSQLPLILAWAITIHKSQGMTLDNMAIDLGRGAFADGQLYVALSRCRRLDQVLLLRPIHQSDLHVAEAVREFEATLRTGRLSRPVQPGFF